MTAAVRVQRLSKAYRVDAAAPRGDYRYSTLRDELVKLARAAWKGRAEDRRRAETFWALRDVDFTIEPGEVVGVIGRNGAGKSTLLKILSRITKPTGGRVELRGRVGSLLEVGTGFHPELTGRENIFLNGAILGMSRREIARKFDAIVAFAEVERFLELPVKRYSSGMYVRLAFAVAAYLEPEILIVDEVLAVGDMAFQRKCMCRMREVGRTGCTVLFVSHNMAAIESLCTRAMLLEGGEFVRDGAVRDLIAEYHRAVLRTQADGVASLTSRDGPDRKVKAFRTATLLDGRGESTNFVALGGRFHLRIELEVDRPIAYPAVTVGIDDPMGQRLLSLCTPLTDPVIEQLSGRHSVECRVDPFPLAPGEYWIKLGLATVGDELDEVERALHFSVIDGDAFGEGRGHHRGLCVAPSRWIVGPER